MRQVGKVELFVALISMLVMAVFLAPTIWIKNLKMKSYGADWDAPYSDEQWESYFAPHNVPEKLKMLIAFERDIYNEFPGEYFASSFELRINNTKSALREYSNNHPEFTQSLFEFADSDGTGSTYAIWLYREGVELADCPVVWLGSEGGLDVVASSFSDFLRLLSFDEAAAGVGESIEPNFRDDSFSISPHAKAYRDWIKKMFSLEPVKTDSEIALPAKKKYGHLFEKWFYSYGG